MAGKMGSSNAFFHFSLVLAAIFLGSVCIPAFAAMDGTLYIVDSLEDVVEEDGKLTLREAVQAANTNTAVNEAAPGSAGETDVIIFEPELLDGTGVIELTDTLTMTGDLYIEGSIYNPLTITGDCPEALVNITGKGASVTLSGLKFTGTSQREIYVNMSAFAHLDCCVFVDIKGGVSAYLADLSAYGCDFIDNHLATDYGAIINSSVGLLEISECRFVHNTAPYTNDQSELFDGVTISIYKSDAVILNSVFAENSGNVISAERSEIEITGCRFTENGNGSGHLVQCTHGELNISDCEINFNHSSGVAARNAQVKISRTYLCQNDGAGYIDWINYGSTIDIDNCVIAGNRDGGIARFNGDLTLTNCTIAGNSKSSDRGGAGIYNSFESSSAANLELNNCIVTDNYCGEAGNQFQSDIYDINDVFYNNTLIGVDAVFVRRPSAGDDGIWGSADDDIGDLRLRSDSPAIGLGDSDLLALYRDYRSYDIMGSERSKYLTSDIGAYEFIGKETVQYETPSFTVTTAADIVDFNDNLISLREAIMYVDKLGNDSGEIDFDPSLDGETIVLELGPLAADEDMYINAGPSDITIDANGSCNAFRTGDWRHAFSLDGLTITGSRNSALMLRFGDMHITRCKITGNGTKGCLGGGINYTVPNKLIRPSTNYVTDDRLIVKNTFIIGNRASMGGGIYCLGYCANAEFYNVVIAGNSAYHEGGAAFLANTDYTNDYDFRNCTIASNQGGIFNYIPNTNLYNSIITMNTDEYRPYEVCKYDHAYNCIIGEDPCFVSDPYIGDDGQWGTDDDDYGNLRLRSDSPAIDAGNNNYYSTWLSRLDISGYNRVVGELIDIGAYEYDAEFVNLADLNGDGNVNIFDFLVLRANYGTTSGADHTNGDLDSDGDVDMTDFLIFRSCYNKI